VKSAGERNYIMRRIEKEA